MAALYAIVCLATAGGTAVFLGAFLGAVSSPQQAAIAAMGIGCAVLPYIFVRAIDLGGQIAWRKRMLDAATRAAPIPSPAAHQPPPAGQTRWN